MADRRLYAQFTLDYADSHKIAPLSDAAFRAHVRMILWSRRMLTDGRIPGAMALVLCDRKKKVLAELTSNDAAAPSLVQDGNGDYVLHDFLDHQQSAAQVEANRATNRANGARGGAAKAARTRGEQPPEPPPTGSEPPANRYRTGSETNGDRVPDFYTESESESETNNSSERTRPVLETAISPATDDDESDQARRDRYWLGWGIANPLRITSTLAAAVERHVTEDQAIAIVAGIVGKAKTRPKSVERYVLAAIGQSWAEIQQEFDEAAVAA